MSSWRERNERAVLALRAEPWAARLVASVNRRGIRWEEEDFLFELRYAHDLVRAGLRVEYESPTGMGNSSVDFKIAADVPWLVELVRLRESAAVKAATVFEKLPSGLIVETLNLSSHAGVVDPARAEATPQHELLRVTQKLGDKVFDGKKPIKFPKPDGSAFHMILMDMRGFEGMGFPDRDDCRQIVGGPRMVSPSMFVAYHPETGEPIHGVWDPDNSSTAARLLRERVHVIGFVHEQKYCDDEIRDATVIFLNPEFFGPSDKTTYPLRAAPESLPARGKNSLWGAG